MFRFLILKVYLGSGVRRMDCIGIRVEVGDQCGGFRNYLIQEERQDGCQEVDEDVWIVLRDFQVVKLVGFVDSLDKDSEQEGDVKIDLLCF